MAKIDIEQQAEKGTELFKSGYNCAQSVAAAYAEHYGIPQELALRMAASFGGGIGRMRETCGAACGMFLLAGLECGSTDAKDQKAKGDNYKVVQQLAEEFKQRNGSIICAELLGLRAREHSPIPEERTQTYYQKRPCIKMVEEACRIYGQYLNDKQEEPQTNDQAK